MEMDVPEDALEPAQPALVVTTEPLAAPALSGSAFWRALGFGVAAAVVGSLLYAAVHIGVSALMGRNENPGYGLIALALVVVRCMGPVVALLIARAMLFGSGQRGGRAYRIVAALLTYIAISMAEVPLLLWQFHDQGVSKFSAGLIGDMVEYGLESPLLAMNDLTSGVISLLFLIGSMAFAWRLTSGPRKLKPAKA